MKKLFKITIVAVFVIAGYGVYTSQKTDSAMSELMLVNTEALADPEVIIGIPCAQVKYNYCLYFYPWEQWEEEGVPYT